MEHDIKHICMANRVANKVENKVVNKVVKRVEKSRRMDYNYK